MTEVINSPASCARACVDCQRTSSQSGYFNTHCSQTTGVRDEPRTHRARPQGRRRGDRRAALLLGLGWSGAGIRQGAACQKRGGAHQTALRAAKQGARQQVREGSIRILQAPRLAQDVASKAHVFPRTEKSQKFFHACRQRAKPVSAWCRGRKPLH